MTASLHAGSFRSNQRVPSVYPIPSSLSDSSRVFVVDDEGVPVARSQNNGKTTIGASQGRWVPHRTQATFLGASSVDASPRTSRTRDPTASPRRRGLPALPSHPRHLRGSSAFLKKGTSYERSTANHEQASGRGRPTHGRQAPLRRPRAGVLGLRAHAPGGVRGPRRRGRVPQRRPGSEGCARALSSLVVVFEPPRDASTRRAPPIDPATNPRSSPASSRPSRFLR